MKTAYIYIATSMLLFGFNAQAISVQCRGVDAHKEQIAVRVADIELTPAAQPLSGSLLILTLKGRQTVCPQVQFAGDKNWELTAACESEKGTLSLNLKIQSKNKYSGKFCGQVDDNEIAGLALPKDECLNLYCSAQDLTN